MKFRHNIRQNQTAAETASGAPVLTLLVAVILVCGIAATTASAATIHVPERGNQTIQQAVNNARAGDVIIVHNGTFNENVDVDVSHLTIRSENGSSNCSVRASADDHVFEVTADYVNISGFTVTGVTIDSWYVGIYIGNQAEHCNISCNNVSENSRGIYLDNSKNNTLMDNYCSKNMYGIRLDRSSGNILTGNDCSRNRYGISLFSSSDNMLAGNIVNMNDYDGIELSSSSNDTLKGNDCSENSNGINLRTSSGNMLAGNGCSDNDRGINLQGSSENALTGNVADSNNWCGIELYSSNGNMLTGNDCSENDRGIELSSSSENTLTGNIANSNNWCGVYLDGSSENTLTKNTANSNSVHGIYIDGSSENTLTENTMSENAYNFGVAGWDMSHYVQSMDASNMVDGLPVCYWVNQHDRTVPDGSGYVGVVNATNITVGDMALTKNCEGVLFAYTEGSRIKNITASSNRVGIRLQCSDANRLTGNDCSENEYGIYLDDSSENMLTENTMSENAYNFGVAGWKLPHYVQSMDASNMVDGLPVCYWVNQHDLTVPNGSGYVGIVNATNITVGDMALTKNCEGVLFAYTEGSRIMNITASSNREGIRLYSSNNNAVTENRANLNDMYGISLYGSGSNALTGNTAGSNGGAGISLRDLSDNNTLTENTADSNGGDGISLSSSDNNAITSNDCSNDRSGICLFWSSNNALTGNTANSNDRHGIHLYDSSDSNVIAENTVSSNDRYGIYLGAPHIGNPYAGSLNDNLIYNNCFNNTKNAFDNGYNTWNRTPTPGTNIVGGPYIGGNYWSDYSGNDTDYDGIGDTFTPYNASGDIETGGDNHPLIMISTSPPVITNVTNSTPTTNSVTITWTTDRACDSLLKYGTWDGNYTEIRYDAVLVTSHEIVLTGLAAGTTYYFAVTSTDGYGYSNESAGHSFTTAADMSPPIATGAFASRDVILNDNGRLRKPGTNVTVIGVTVTRGGSEIAGVTINLSAIGGSASQPMERTIGTDAWTVTTNATRGINQTHQLRINATDTNGNYDNSAEITLTVLRRGDVYRDNVVDGRDVMYIARYLAHLEPETVNPPTVLVGDVSGVSGDPVGDGVVDLVDVVYIMRCQEGLEDEP